MAVAALIISIISALAAGISAYFNKRANEISAAATQEAHDANVIADSQNKIAQGEIELHIHQMITQTSKDIIDVSLKSSEASGDIKKKEALLTSALNTAVENYLNAFEQACSVYIDNKVDRERFKKNYSAEIRELVENPAYNKKIDTCTIAYKCIRKVYTEWFDFEK